MKPLVAIIALFTLTAASGCWSGDYLAKQGVGQLKLLRARRRIDEVLRDPSVPAETRRRLTLARDAREFGVRVLGLHGGDGFTRFVDSHGAPIAWNVTAAQKDKLEAHLNRFPIVGAIPYLGFFDEHDAAREAERLRAQDLDVYVRPVAGYSTLGITADPIFSSMLDGPDARIVEVTLHEMTHATVYLPGHSDWNESLATVVGNEGAAQFFAARGDAAQMASLVAEARRREREQEAFARFLEPVVRALESLYQAAGADPRAEAGAARAHLRRRAPAIPRALSAAAGLQARRIRRRAAEQRGDACRSASTTARRRSIARFSRELGGNLRRVRRAVQARRRGQARSAGVSRLRAREDEVGVDRFAEARRRADDHCRRDAPAEVVHAAVDELGCTAGVVG